MTNASSYVLGHGDFELNRLQLQAELIGSITRRLLSESGVCSGMRVLDIGCGIGDVSMLLAQVVGPNGSVLAIDREPRAIEIAKSRAAAAGHVQIEFVATSDDSLPNGRLFDAAIGRYVLVHQPDPLAMVRNAAAAVRSGGIVAFHEPALYVMAHTVPEIDLYKQIMDCLIATFRDQLKSYDVGGRLIEVFEKAGLSPPQMIWESIVGGPGSSLIRWGAMTFLSMLPRIANSKLAYPNIDPEKLEEQLFTAVEAARAQVISAPQCCVWALRP